MGDSKCVICNSNMKKGFLTKDYRYRTKGDFTYNYCSTCNIYQLDRKKSYNGYPNKYYSFKLKPTKGFKFNFSLFLYNNLYSNKNWFFKVLFNPFKIFTRGTVISKKSRLLDVGCGAGDFLAKMKLLGMSVRGIEPGQINKKHMKQFNIQSTTINKSHFNKNYFDTILMNHVIEHTKSPVADIKKLKSYLKPGGVFIISTPIIDSYAFKLFKKYWAQVDAPRHLVLFSKDALVNTLKKMGFEVVQVRYNSMPFQFTSSIEYFLKENNIEFKFPKIFFYLFFPLAFFVNIIKTGDQIEVWARKL